MRSHPSTTLRQYKFRIRTLRAATVTYRVLVGLPLLRPSNTILLTDYEFTKLNMESFLHLNNTLHLTLIHQMACCEPCEYRIAVKAWQILYYCHLLSSVHYDLKQNYALTKFKRKKTWNLQFLHGYSILALFTESHLTRHTQMQPILPPSSACLHRDPSPIVIIAQPKLLSQFRPESRVLLVVNSFPVR